MAQGYSTHIGVNYLNINHYGGTGALKSCENDARYMRKIAQEMGYTSTMILTRNATRKKVYDALTELSNKALKGDMVLITYSGHGSFIPDLNNDEEDDDNDETWCLYDAQLVDDEIFSLLCKFKEGVRVLIITDSCHNETIYKAVDFSNDLIPKCLNTQKSVEVFQKNQLFYENIPLLMNQYPVTKCKASVLTISACSDMETTGAGLDRFSLSAFTKSLKAVWESGFKGDYSEFVNSIHKQDYGRQPQISPEGKNTEIFRTQKPLSI